MQRDLQGFRLRPATYQVVLRRDGGCRPLRHAPRPILGPQAVLTRLPRTRSPITRTWAGWLRAAATNGCSTARNRIRFSKAS